MTNKFFEWLNSLEKMVWGGGGWGQLYSLGIGGPPKKFDHEKWLTFFFHKMVHHSKKKWSRGRRDTNKFGPINGPKLSKLVITSSNCWNFINGSYYICLLLAMQYKNLVGKSAPSGPSATCMVSAPLLLNQCYKCYVISLCANRTNTCRIIWCD